MTITSGHLKCVTSYAASLPKALHHTLKSGIELLVYLAFIIKVKITLRLTVGQSVSLGVEPHLELMTRYLLLFDSYSLVSVERPL
jgi:hypothetical protein